MKFSEILKAIKDSLKVLNSKVSTRTLAIILSIVLICAVAFIPWLSQHLGDQGRNSSNNPATTGGARPLALVYRGPGGCKGCSEATAALLQSSKWNFEVKFVGPKEPLELSAATLKSAVLYAQPGGKGDARRAYKKIMRQLDDPNVISDWVKAGGRYLGICMGGYLAGDSPTVPGFGVLPGTVGEWIHSPGASWTSDKDTVLQVNWRDHLRWMYFQDGPYFQLNPGATGVQVLATYTNGKIAALVAPHGKGKVAVVGPHPEADETWYSEYNLTDPDGPDADLGHDLINTLME
ncbi:MAG: hypothetical protein J2P37_02480 [Ktedonobacteraceae bacterium]|nr:hypothetical protein [Ktedonobacteraceae bacterium]MBO0790921.1 hypothetical protein [Ktedonobacteraceae bacterium]